MLKQIYTKESVLDATKKRISYIFDEFENICVSVSGGKDSTVLAYLVLSEAHRRNRKVKVLFIDEEVVYQSTIEQIRYIMNMFPENTIPCWLQFEFYIINVTSFKDAQLKCWEKGKSKIWLRHKEPTSIQNKPWSKEGETSKTTGFDFYDVINNFQRINPNTCFFVGLRASECIHRWRAVSKNAGYKDVYYSTNIGNGSISCYPLYDWNFSDIWKFIYDNKLKYNKIYDYQFQKGMHQQEMRVSSLIHEHSFKALVELPEFEPETYDKLLKRIGGMSVGHIYGRDTKMMQVKKLPKNFNTWKDYRDFLLETYPDESKKEIFTKRFARQLDNSYVARQQCRQLILYDYENNLPIDNKPDPREKTMQKWRDLL